MNEDLLPAHNRIEGLKAHLARADALLDYVDDSLDAAVRWVDQHPVGALRARFEFVLCIFPLAPLEKISACLAGGGLVAAIIGTKLEWTTAALRATGGVRGVQVMACSAAEATVVYTGGASIEIKDPGKKMLAVVLFWVGG